MSNLRVGTDDHPEAAGKHLADAAILLERKSFDGGAYLSGYVVECALKSVVLHDRSWHLPATRDVNLLRSWHHKLRAKPYGHNLLQIAAIMVGTEGTRYMPDLSHSPSVFAWTESLRYSPSGTIPEDKARAWHQWASFVFMETVLRMRLDGVL
jgi:hypothetical protein